ncbi:signal recognition particle-docking protein FtsY [Candidatus Anaplasma sp. TIGMIC]|uniref:signal recognition particle-docking protein FtsY n=1 Tax=Candidatus Anaplasma sp. TIGMIC TaxID=3020713 RepID=UPI00232C79EB|nr:signal recognition particle-docking protein FtsY [Candidatus Anaplasma sp. TIGMIC]MDB1135780.1 signal recognition particle-docking protein FtsY [Candidatus Anaplasma sp. TIGMIC]
MKQSEGFWSSLQKSLCKTSSKLSEGIRSIFKGGAKVDHATLKSLRELLISTDMGTEAAAFFTERVASMQFSDAVEDEIKQALAKEIESFLQDKARPITTKHTPHIILLCGVNGSGKTTTIAKLARKFQTENKTVLFGACDTFRAAAVEQLSIWAHRLSCPIVAGELGADAASVAYRAVQQAINDGVDVVLIDTAGRLHNNKNLMEELAKVCRVIRRHDETAPHDIVLVLDATIGQNTFTQVETFSKFVTISGVILTKLDGTAKGGILLRIAQKYDMLLHAVGTGEGIDDFADFSAKEFAKGLLDI